MGDVSPVVGVPPSTAPNRRPLATLVDPAIRLEVLDPAALLWQSVDAHAPALLAEVAHLAVVFGWSQESVLAMSHARRAPSPTKS